MNGKMTRKLTESAVFIALGTILSILKIDLPFGGGVTIASMLPLVLISHRWGWKWGVLTALGIIFLDYIIAYTVIGFSGVFDRPLGKTRASMAVGIAVTFVLRFCCHLLTGVWIWGEWMPETFMNMTMTSPWLYSFLYNGWYMLAELVVTEVIAMLIYKPLASFIQGQDVKNLK